jgi:hypothetical protein
VSNINFAAIDENFPVAGQDNDTQTFRDNFDTIKTALRNANEEVTDLQDNTARTDQDNDFNDKIISRAVMQFNRDSLFDGGAISVPVSVDYQNGYHQIFRFGANIVLGFLQFPNDLSNPPGVGKVVLECYSDGAERTITLDPSGGVAYKKSSWDPGWIGNSFKVNSSSNPLLLEVWRYSNQVIFVRNLGVYS